MRSLAAWALAAGTSLAGAACAASGTHLAAPIGGDETSWRYEVTASTGARELWIDAWLPTGSLADLVVRHGAERFVRDAEVEGESGWRDVPRRGGAFHAAECARGCHLRYRFLLRQAAEALGDIDMAIAWNDVLEASPSVWLLHPTLAPAGTRYRFHVRSRPEVAFTTGIFVADEGRPETYEADASNIGVAPYAAFGPMRMRHVEAVNGTTIDLAIAPASYAVSDDAMVAWVSRSARTMARYFGCFPIERVSVLVVPARGADVRHGETMGDGGASIVVELGEGAKQDALDHDWVLPHEMAHLGVPSVSRRHHWLEEGIAVYVQPIARARVGELHAEEVWREFLEGMPRGIPQRGDAGLDDTPSWARTYWGGATFCLLADVEIRRRTHNRLGFEDALRGILSAGGSVAHIWDFDRVLETADASIGTTVFRSMHEEMGREGWSVDLPRLFRDLGVAPRGDRVVFDDSAPLAALRRSITEPFSDAAPEPTACRWAAPGRMAQR
jgi:hypothetical protein